MTHVRHSLRRSIGGSVLAVCASTAECSFHFTSSRMMLVATRRICRLKSAYTVSINPRSRSDVLVQERDQEVTTPPTMRIIFTTSLKPPHHPPFHFHTMEENGDPFAGKPDAGRIKALQTR